jgi:hypothetical protein
MTEAEWLTATDPDPMLEFQRGNASDRKLRLFAVACCYRVWDILPNKCRKALSVAEQYADGAVTSDKLSLAGFRANVAARVEHRREPSATGWAMWAVAEVCEANIARLNIGTLRTGTESELLHTEWRSANILRDIIGNPFRPITLDPAWRTEAVVGLAAGVYADRAFDRLPVLADALEDAGCADADVLTHCRGPGPHVRGCWVVDLLLGKS